MTTLNTESSNYRVDFDQLVTMATAVRMLATDMVDAANSGHPGLPLGAADVATTLFARHLRYDARYPRWPDRDRFVLSGGHGSALLYALGYLIGADGVELDHLRRFRQFGSPCAGHPEVGEFPTVETTTGPLGQGIANAVGMAIAEERLRAEFGADMCDHRTWVLAGDGCLMEGVTAEAIALAGHLRLGRLTVLWDDNRITIEGSTSLATSEDQITRFMAAGWNTISIDGHDFAAIDEALTRAAGSDRPTLVACRTTIGKGAPNKAGSSSVHGSPLGSEERGAMAQQFGWPEGRFDVPDDVRNVWRDAGRRGAAAHLAWSARVETNQLIERFAQRCEDSSPDVSELDTLRSTLLELAPQIATRAVNALVLDALSNASEDDPGPLLGGSADLAGSNGLTFNARRRFTADDRLGNFVDYGIREHAMAAAMNGIALHGGLRPYGGTFLAFADYSRPAIRLAALMHLGVIHVFTHDSIGVGEDGPTHQPVEQLCALRAIPGLVVIRPADAVETVEAWQVALRSARRPTVLALSRQNVPALDRSRVAAASPSGVAAGGYTLIEPQSGEAVITLIGSGSEVQLAVAAASLLAGEGVVARVVSMPSMELFSERPLDQQQEVLGAWPRVVVEASIGQSWHRWLRPGDALVTMPGFGASAPAELLFEHFGITSAAVAAAARTCLGLV